MKKTFGFFAAFSLSCFNIAALPVAIVGEDETETRIFGERILQSNHIAYRRFQMLPTQEYNRYAAVCLVGKNSTDNRSLWSAPVDFEQVKNYLEKGGLIILTAGMPYALDSDGSLSQTAELTGILELSGNDKAEPPEITPASGLSEFGVIDNRSYHWSDRNAWVSKYIHTMKPLFVLKVKDKTIRPVLTVNDVGRGKITYLVWNIGEIIKKLAPLAEPDEKGEMLLTATGEEFAALSKLFGVIIRKHHCESGGELEEIKMRPSSWGKTPLGPAGTLTYPENLTANCKIPEKIHAVCGKGWKIAENGMPKTVIVKDGNGFGTKGVRGSLEDEFKYYLDQITGTDIPVIQARTVKFTSAAVVLPPPYRGYNAIIFASPRVMKWLDLQEENKTNDWVRLKTINNMLVIGGNPGGISPGMTLVAEKLGVRYLWPGKLGKVIPRVPELEIPAFDFNMEPGIRYRGIRPDKYNKNDRMIAAWRRIGMERSDGELLNVRAYDKEFCRDWFGFHPLGGDRDGLTWGHSFGNYWMDYKDSHPEWFALQRMGHRDQGVSPTRPTFCLSNQELLKQFVKDKIAGVESKPQQQCAVLCLPDGGYTTACMCEECRKLDPVNAMPLKIIIIEGAHREWFDYVSLSDRILCTFNKVLREVCKKHPDARGTYYAYSNYETPPIVEAPHRNMVIVLVPGSYRNRKERETAIDYFLRWSAFGNKTFWRPNALNAFSRETVPANFARQIFDDTEMMRQKHLVGTDHDCFGYDWALSGLNYYVLVKSLWNMENWSYDEIVADYIEKGFGPAKEEIGLFFTELEQWTLKAQELPGADFGKPDTLANKLYTQAYSDRLLHLLALAENKVKNAQDSIVEERIDFLRQGVLAGVHCRKLYEYHASGDTGKYQEALLDFFRFIRESYAKYPEALSPGRIGYWSVYR